MMKNKFSSLFFVLCSLFFVGCERLDMSGMFYGSSPRNNERFADSMKYNEANGYQTVVAPSDDYKVYFATDFHVDSTTLHTQHWVRAIQADSECIAAVALGDMMNGRQKYDYFLQAIAPLREASFPLFITAGNHDIYFSEWPSFVEHFGTATYYFEVQTPHHKDLYICLDTSDGTVGTDQMKWLRETFAALGSTATYRHVIIYTHTHMFKPDGAQGHTSNFPMEETYELLDVLGANGVDWYVSGHRHSRDVREFRGVTYYILDAIQESYPDADAFYMVALVGETLQAEFVSLAE